MGKRLWLIINKRVKDHVIYVKNRKVKINQKQWKHTVSNVIDVMNSLMKKNHLLEIPKLF